MLRKLTSVLVVVVLALFGDSGDLAAGSRHRPDRDHDDGDRGNRLGELLERLEERLHGRQIGRDHHGARHFACLVLEYDDDGDGELSEEERAAAAEARKADLLAEFDADGDGELSREERGIRYSGKWASFILFWVPSMSYSTRWRLIVAFWSS